MIERRIKELSFALEALSRINHYEATECMGRVGILLRDALSEAEKPIIRERERPTSPITSGPPPWGKKPVDDEIPF